MAKDVDKKVSKAQELYQELKQVLRGRDLLVWRGAELLYGLKEQKLYKFVFGMEEKESNKDSWKSFVAEIGVPLSTADYWIAVYKKWIIEFGFKVSDLKDINIRKMAIAIPLATSKEKATELLGFARELSIGEFQKILRKNEEPCWHLEKEIRDEKVKYCKACNKKVK